MYVVNSSDPSPVSCLVTCENCSYIFVAKEFVFEGISKNVTCLGFYDDGRFMFSGGEDCSARIWDLRQVLTQHPRALIM